MPAVAVNNMLELIGGTPLVRLRHLIEPGMADVFCKCEQFNPGGSVKDRVALSMIEAAERAGRLHPGESVIVEPTSGNTGVGLALVAASKRYRLILTMPDNMSLERRALLKAYGAEVYLTPAAEVMTGAVKKAVALCEQNPDYFMPQQFNNPANVESHVRTTGPEIVAQLGARACDAFIAAVGTGGTISGVGQVLRQRNPAVRIVAVEPDKSAVLSGGKPAAHRIDGIGAGFIPPILDRSIISEVRTISEQDAQKTKLELARREGLLVGISAGANVKIALDVARELGPGKTVVTVLCDTGERYFSSDALFLADRTDQPVA
ncbi:MAG: cysteine synthase A [Deltaproteobacteria bacterium]|nr:cysteine synthase A [Deltaproteobacteria bacterium]